ncbi:TBC domain-containing protein [Cryptosporidium serpentis]
MMQEIYDVGLGTLDNVSTSEKLIHMGFIRRLLLRHNNSLQCRAILNSTVFNYLEDKDLEEISMVCKLWFAEVNSVEVYQSRYPIGFYNFCDKKRRWIWKCVLVGDETCSEINYIQIDKQLESSNVNEVLLEKNSISSSKYYSEILKDVNRTYPNVYQFKAKQNQDTMAQLLCRIAKSLPQVGYCQGMNYVLGIILYVFNFELELSFSAMMKLLINWEYQQVYKEGFDKLHKMCYTFNILVEKYLPNIYHNIFIQYHITSELFAIPWFITLFTYDLADTIHIKNAVYILDNIMIHDSSKSCNVTIYKFALSLLSAIEYNMKLKHNEERNSDVFINCTDSHIETKYNNHYSQNSTYENLINGYEQNDKIHEMTDILQYIREESKYILTDIESVKYVIELCKQYSVTDADIMHIQSIYRDYNNFINIYKSNYNNQNNDGIFQYILPDFEWFKSYSFHPFFNISS